MSNSTTRDLEDWITTPQARCLIEIPIDPKRFEQALDVRIRLAWLAGHAAAKRGGERTE